MSQTVITQAFEELKAQEAANGGVLTLDEFVFASVPNLNITDPIDRTEGLPPAAQIVHRQAVSKTGMVNGNAVVYSVVLGADVGDFEFNWVGLLNKASGVVAMIVHAPSQKKIRTQSGQQGNVLTRSFLMEYNGASEQTQIITPADTWQIDFTARLNGVDERIRLENRDTYGPASFLKDGFLVAGANGNYQVKKGVAYIEGLRAELQFDQALAVAVRPSKIWLDVCWRGTLTSVWATATRLTVADNLSNYVEGDEQHYVFAIADILADGSVIDLRRNTPLAQVMELSAEPNTVPYFDKDTKLKMFAYQETPHVSPEMYGAKETISAADTQAIIDAFATAKAMGVGLKLSRLYKCAGNITLTSFISDVFGLGQGQTGIIFEPGCGFVVDNSSISGTRKAMRIINTSLRTRGAKDATALRFKGTHSAKYGEQLKLTDVLFATDETGAFGWDCCLHLDQASQVFMDHCSMSGLGAVPTNCCIRLTNQSRDINFTNGCASDFLDFMDVTSGSEGVTVAFNHIIAGQRGVISHDTGGNMIFILGNHFNTSISAVELGEGTGLGSNHCKIANNFCIVYNKPGDESKPYVAFDICSNENALSHNNVLLTGFTKDATHTRLRQNTGGTRSASGNTIANPISDGLTRSVVISSGAASNQIYGNQRIGMTLANDIIDNGTNTRYWLLDSDINAFLTSDLKLARLGAAGVRQIRAHTGLDTTTASGVIRFIGGAEGVANDAVVEITCRETVTKTLRPSTTNAYNCGVAGAAWAGGATQTAFTVTSDETYKTKPVMLARGTTQLSVTSGAGMMELPHADTILDAWSEVDFVQFKYLDRVEAKGEDGARWHFGVIAQRAIEAFARHGLDAFAFGFACYDEWGDQDEVVEFYEAIPDLFDGNGNLVQPGREAYSEIITPAKKAGSKFGIRYEEALVLEAALQRRNFERLQVLNSDIVSRIEALEAR